MTQPQKDKIIHRTENVKMRGYGESVLGSLNTGQDGGEIEPTSQPIVTIDDLEAQVEQLLADIRILKTYKYPLGIRRGVKQF